MSDIPTTDVEMIFSVSELTEPFLHSQDIRGFLSRVVHVVSHHMQTDVCSIFLYNEEENHLVLEATEGLNPQMVGTLTLAWGEGLTGLALKELRPISEGRGVDNPYFKFVPESGEGKFESFLAVPIIRGIRRVGVMVLQDERGSRFSKSDVRALQAIAAQLAATIEDAMLLISLSEKKKTPRVTPLPSKLIRGTQVVEGVVLGRAYQVQESDSENNQPTDQRNSYGKTIDDFNNAIAQTEEQLEQLQKRLEEELADVASLIFSAHLLMLRDEGFSGEMANQIGNGLDPSQAVKQVTDNYTRIFASSSNPRMKEKVLDIKDLKHRILENLLSDKSEHGGGYHGQIIITNELLPSELLKLATQNAAGLVLYGSGVTAHVSVLASSLQIPLICTSDESVLLIPSNTSLILDAIQGTLIVQPDNSTTSRVKQFIEASKGIGELEKYVQPETQSLDGQRIHLRAAVNLLSDLDLSKRLKAEGIGLYRSEFPFLVRSDFPSEEEQYRIYKKVVEGLDNPVVTLRTLDVGGDKILSYIPDSDEANPFLGLRSIRFLLENKKVFIGQLKAMIRASRNKRIRILFPLISSVDDFKNARRMVLKSLSFLKRDGFEGSLLPKLGAMIELPSAVEMAPELARVADFLSLGTNDLVQYTLGVDRTNEKVADLFDIRHPAVLRAVKRVSDAAKEASCPLSVCGIMTKDPRTVYYMIGLGIRDFTMEPAAIPGMQKSVSEMDTRKASEDAKKISSLGTIKEIHEFTDNLKLNRTGLAGDITI
ncbi:Phosphoenolpyruvate-protein phosphotransferase of PTS system [Olavius algarvensis spirochete endosymbiont]|uniref:phosphoenolpyruvate--protein phosphotransferase n=1 Tax=Olavius algarvensis spirochete endosymbiont TaxID=260710 RepID=UPI00068B6747|nr:phosphoenolpyruvate--protein phosphotransferase [Olavius algarvensis spirochete endosymbiont]VDB00038.1 Phosphoenolpyruvate-protein phosphotransferase of PTS system [Olavius algarvensis spirochete endosymbiont]